MIGALLKLSLLVAAPAPAASGPLDESAAPVKQADPEIALELGARVVLRPEARVNSTFGTTPADDTWRIRQGARLLSAFHFRSLHAVFQLQDVRDWGVETTTLSTHPGTSTHQAFLELSDTDMGARGELSGYLRVGRQEVKLWNRRLLGDSPWAPSARAFDAARGRLEVGPIGFEAGAILLRQPRSFALTDGDTETSYRSSGEQLYWGEAGYVAHRAFAVHVSTLALVQGGTEGEPDRERRILTPGVYLHGEPLPRFTYQLEAYGQLGHDGDTPHRAWSGAATLAYTGKHRLRPGVSLGYELASGSECADPVVDSSDCGAEVIRDFDQHFGARHLYRGHTDLLGMSNMRDLHLRGRMAPDPTLTLVLDYHLLGLDAPGGAWRNTGGALVAGGWNPSNDKRDLGHEVDMVVDYRPFERLPEQLRVRPGYALFIPGRGGYHLGATEPQHFVYLWIVAKLGTRWNAPAK
jgi:hypothetical protein